MELKKEREKEGWGQEEGMQEKVDQKWTHHERQQLF
jgi:hypothetical protein